MALITNAVADTLLERLTSVVSTRRNLDSSLEEIRKYELTPQQIEYLKTVFYYNRGTMADGKVLRLSQKEIYFKFQVNFSLLEENESSFIRNAYERADGEKESISIYCNGSKIPDKQVYYYSTLASTDIFIPESLIDPTKNNIIYVEKRAYSKGEYVNFYDNSFSGNRVSVPIDLEKYNNCNINAFTTMIFVGKKLYTGSRTVQKNTTNISVSLGTTLDKQEIEIYVDNSVKYYNSTYFENTKKLAFSVPESYIDPIHGPIAIGSCLFFIDGLRIPNINIVQDGRMNFSYDLTEISSPTISIYVTDKEIIDDSKMIIYGSDYYLYNMIGVAAVTKFYKGFLTNSIFDGNIDFNAVLNENGLKFDRATINDLTSVYASLTAPQTKTSYLLHNRPYLMRTFLEQYGKNVYSYNVYYNGINQTVILGLPLDTKPASDTSYIININNQHVPVSAFKIIDKGVTDIFEIPGEYFVVGDNIVEITLLSGKYPLTYFKVSRSAIVNNGGTLTYTTDKFKSYSYSLSDIIILEKKVNDTAYTYPTSSNVGYVINTHAHVFINTDNSLSILFDTIPDNDFIIYYKNFVYTYSYTKELTNSYEDVFVPIYVGSAADPIPLLGKGNMEVYAGRDKLIPGLDYFIKDPTNESTVTYSLLIIKRLVDPYTEINVYFNNIKNNTLIKKEGYFENNEYGLFYFGDLPFPVSLNYLNIYLNGKSLNKTDIDILSDKLIRVHSLSTPMYDLSVESAFSVDFEILEPYFDLYVPDAFELFIQDRFRGVFYTRTTDIINDNPPNVNDIYETFVTQVDSVNRVKNEVARESEWYPYNEATTSCITNDGSAMGGENIYNISNLGKMLFFAGGKGRVSCCDITNNGWHGYNEITNSFIVNDGSAMTFKDIYTTQIYDNKFITMGKDGMIAFCNLLTGQWTNADSVGGSDLPKNNGNTIFLGDIICSLLHNDLLIIAGSNGRVASYSFTNKVWCGYSDNIDNMISNVGVATNGNAIRFMYIEVIDSEDVLFVAGDNGVIATCFMSYNVWTKWDGSQQQTSLFGPSISSDGAIRNNKDIYKILKYGKNIIFLGEDGYISTYNTSDKKFYGSSVSETFNLTNAGTVVGNKTIHDASLFRTSAIMVGCDNGIISSYSASTISWNMYNSLSGIVNNGVAMGGNDIYATLVYDLLLSYFIVAGKGGRVASYNVDVHELPYRFDPYKTAFLLYYTTPGNAEIKVPYEIPESLITKFRIYKDLELNSNFDIVIRPSDMDLMQTINMNDGGRYPREQERRRRFIAQFIESLTDQRLTVDEVYAKYKESPMRNILYLEDIPTLRSGDYLDVDNDIDLT